MQHLVIVGGGHLAAALISGLYKHDFDGQVTLLSAEGSLPCNRPVLSKEYLKGELTEEGLELIAEHIWSDPRFSYQLNTQVSEINRQQKTVVANGHPVPYDQLILATGTTPRRLDIPGHELANIHYLKTLSDAKKLRGALQPGKRLAVIGGGFIGLEIAAAARQAGMAVTLLEAGQRVLGRVVAPEVSDYFLRLHQAQGVEIRTGVGVENFMGQQAIEAVRLTNGEVLTADQVVVGIGVVPEVSLAQQAGLECDNGIVIDQSCRTSDPAIHAGGDCAIQFSPLYNRNLRLESVQNTSAHAQVILAELTGQPIPTSAVPWFWSTQYEARLQIAGLSLDYDQLITRGQDTQARSWLYLKQGRLIACDAINRPADFLQAKKMILTETRIDCHKAEDINIPLNRCIA